MRNRFNRKRTQLALAVLLGSVCMTPPIQQLVSFPTELQIPAGEKETFALSHVTVSSSDTNVACATTTGTEKSNSLTIQPQHIGSATITTKLFGFLPWKSVHVRVIPPVYVYAGGQSVGIRLRTNGVMIVGLDPKIQAGSSSVTHLLVGDVIEKIGQKSVHSSIEMKKFVNENRQDPLQLTIRRGQTHRVIKIHPVTQNGTRHLGLFIRDKVTGVGTLTFYDAIHHRFGALGHVITDVDTGRPIDGQGDVYNAEITGVLKGINGQPGEKRGQFNSLSPSWGHIEQNSPFGVFGTMNSQPLNNYLNHPIPVALPSQVHAGPATMLTVLHGDKIESFSIHIDTLVKQDSPDTKSMIVRVTDPRLLEKTGGIIQGMSGSPILQDGKLVGAVTHVFVSDPTHGYAVYADWMLKQSASSVIEAKATMEDLTARPASI